MTTPTKEMAEAALKGLAFMAKDNPNADALEYVRHETVVTYIAAIEASLIDKQYWKDRADKTIEELEAKVDAIEAENERLLDALLEIRETAALMCSHRTPPECSITDVVDTILKPTEEALKGGE